MKCSICNGKAEYEKAHNGPLCKDCWLGLKMFGFKPDRLSKAKRYLLGRPRKNRKEKRPPQLDTDRKFSQMVREELKTPQTIKIVRDGQIIKQTIASRPVKGAPF